MKRYKLGDLCKVKHGFPFLGEHFLDVGKYIILTPGNFYEEGGFKRILGKEKFYTAKFPEEYLCKKGDLVVAMTQQAEGLLGSTALIPEDGIYLHNQRIGLIFENDKLIDKLFLYYLFMTKTVREQLRNSASGTKVKHTSPERIYDVTVEIPELPEQKAIAKTLYAIERKRLNNKVINDNLAKQIDVIYNYWFTQFEFPNDCGKSYRSNDGVMSYNERLKREIPSTWKVQSVSKNDLASIIKPGVDSFTTKTYLPTSEVNGTSISNGDEIDFETRASRANMQPTVNSVWFAKMKNSIKHLFLNKEMKPIVDSSILSTGFCGLQCDDTSIEYISSFISSRYFETAKDTLAHGATQEAVNNDDLAGIYLVIPDDETLKKYHQATRGLYSQISNNILENRELTKLHNWLFPMFMNGQARVTD